MAMMRYTVIKSPFGSVGLVAGKLGLSKVILTKRKVHQARSYLQKLFPHVEYDKYLLPSLQKQLNDYFTGQRVNFRVKVDLSSVTPFQRLVLQACAKIEYGRTISYGKLARRISKPKAARAVGGALAKNPIPIIIPCHRVIAGDGTMCGFSADQGINLKKRLLDMEADVSSESGR